MKINHKFAVVVLFAPFIVSALAQVADAPDEIKSGIPTNYTESKVGTYSLPDPLKLANGQPVRDAKTWFAKRRPEIIKLFEENQYGKTPITSINFQSTHICCLP